MSSRGTRLVAAALAVVVLVAAVAVVLVVRANHADDELRKQQAGDVASADRAADEFAQKVAAYRDDTAHALAGVDSAHPAKVRKVVAQRVAAVPDLPSAPSYGIHNSADYGAATDAHDALVAQLKGLDAAVDQAVAAQAFVRAANTALDTDPSDFTPSGPVTSGDPLREAILPPMNKALEKFNAATVPQGQQKLAKTVAGALEYVIGEVKVLASHLDRQQSYNFTWDKQYAAAKKSVKSYAKKVHADLDAALADASKG